MLLLKENTSLLATAHTANSGVHDRTEDPNNPNDTSVDRYILEILHKVHRSVAIVFEIEIVRNFTSWCIVLKVPVRFREYVEPRKV